MILLAVGTPWLGRLMAPRIADVWGGCVMNERTEPYALFDPRKDEAADRGLKTECLGKRCIIQVRGVSPTLAILPAIRSSLLGARSHLQDCDDARESGASLRVSRAPEADWQSRHSTSPS